MNVARQLAKGGNWPRVVAAADEVEGMIANLVVEVPNANLVSLWLVPPGDPLHFERLSTFRSHPDDTSLYTSILAGGVVRISIDHLYCDLTGSLDSKEKVLSWLHSTVNTQPLLVRWVSLSDDDD